MTKTFKTQPGAPYPRGATVTETGVNFAVFSANAKRVEVCLFDDTGNEEIARIEAQHCSNQIWHVLIEGLQSGALYGYRVHGPYEPHNGHRFNSAKLLLDPYTRKIFGPFRWSDSLFSYDSKQPHEDCILDTTDSAPDMPKCVVMPSASPAEIEQIQREKPHTPWNQTVIYEAHPAGISQTHPLLPNHLRGKISALADPAMIDYFKSLGITAIELLPLHGFIDEQFLLNKKLSNYWGYNSMNFFAPHKAYLQMNDPQEVRETIKKLHTAGLEVILDVVYNHTGEGNHMGPTLSFRGLDNASYYFLDQHDHRLYVNDSGCGNTLHAKQPRIMQMIMDSLRFWAGEMGVDGFRFDLAAVLGRESYGFDPGAGFFDVIGQDPLLSQCKMIAEPWDLGPGGYQLGHFPSGWSEWNDRYRDTCRQFWRGDSGVLPDFARRIHGSSDLFEHSGRAPQASINFITSHDGFTLHDLVSYNERQNLANGEENRDGHQHNYSNNHGAEGVTRNVEIEELRQRQQRNLLATLLLSQGVPMLLAGDEQANTQSGNNNAYCQNNEIGWLNWTHISATGNHPLYNFVKNVMNIRKAHSPLTSEYYIHNPEKTSRKQTAKIAWYHPSGLLMEPGHWGDPGLKTMGCLIEQVAQGNNERHRVLFILFNANSSDLTFTLPKINGIQVWHPLLNTENPCGEVNEQSIAINSTILMIGKSLQVLAAQYDSATKE